MRSHRALVILAAVATAAGVLVTLWALMSRPSVSLTSMARLRPGMTEADVAAVLGQPTADLTGHEPAGVPAPVAGGRLLEYASDRATARVEYGPGGRLVRVHAAAVRKVSGLERLRLRLDWW